MKKQISIGTAIGLLIPAIFVAILYIVFFVFEKKMTNQVISSGLLFGLGLNALLMRFYFKKDKDYRARGIMLASFAFFLFIVIKFMMYSE